MGISEKKNWNIILALLVLCCIQNIDIISIQGAALKPSHIFSLAFFPFLLKKGTMEFRGKAILAYFSYLVLCSILNLAEHPLNGLIFNYIFGIYLLILIFNFGRDIVYSEWTVMFQAAAIIMMSIVLIKNMLEIKAFLLFFQTLYGHPYIPTIFGGGVNLEATWLGLFGFAFEKGKKAWVYNFLALFISVIYASRAGFVVNVLCLLWLAWKTYEKKIIWIVVLLIAIQGIFLLISSSFDVVNYILVRFKNMGRDPGSMGRLTMWKYVGQAVSETPFGVGIGNNMLHIEQISGRSFGEGNLHNLYFQMFIDLGWLGGIGYILMVLRFSWKEIRNIFHNAFVAMLFVYLALSCIQFRGGEPIIFFVLGVYLLNRQKDGEEYASGEGVRDSAGI